MKQLICPEQYCGSDKLKIENIDIREDGIAVKVRCLRCRVYDNYILREEDEKLYFHPDTEIKFGKNHNKALLEYID